MRDFVLIVTVVTVLYLSGMMTVMNYRIQKTNAQIERTDKRLSIIGNSALSDPKYNSQPSLRAIPIGEVQAWDYTKSAPSYRGWYIVREASPLIKDQILCETDHIPIGWKLADCILSREDNNDNYRDFWDGMPRKQVERNLKSVEWTTIRSDDDEMFGFWFVRCYGADKKLIKKCKIRWLLHFKNGNLQRVETIKTK